MNENKIKYVKPRIICAADCPKCGYTFYSSENAFATCSKCNTMFAIGPQDLSSDREKAMRAFEKKIDDMIFKIERHDTDVESCKSLYSEFKLRDGTGAKIYILITVDDEPIEMETKTPAHQTKVST